MHEPEKALVVDEAEGVARYVEGRRAEESVYRTSRAYALYDERAEDRDDEVEEYQTIDLLSEAGLPAAYLDPTG